LLSSASRAQEAGDAKRGLALAQQICSECHAVTKTQPRSPNPASPRFETIANVPGMTRTALSAALQSPHRTMPNIMLDADQLSDIISYLLSLKTN
jgi:mono/diheme cytochrome c family protein